MNIWRMKMRAGKAAKGGDDMWPLCRDRGIASFTHGPILNTDLTNIKKEDVNPAITGSARPSIFWFAWEIKGGDVIYVGDAATHSLIGRGTVVGEPGKRAYRYNAGQAIKEPSDPSTAWRHEVPVEWDLNFKPFFYKDPAPQNSVFPFKPSIVEDQDTNQEATDEDEVETSGALLNELAYQRETPASKKNIARLHVSLSNHFRLWLEREFAVKVAQEKQRIDLTFTTGSKRHLAELKICYCAGTRHAIREAIGQLFEYNYYPSYREADVWWLVLDCEPSQTDFKYISNLTHRYGIPLTLAWSTDDDFKVFPSLPF